MSPLPKVNPFYVHICEYHGLHRSSSIFVEQDIFLSYPSGDGEDEELDGAYDGTKRSITAHHQPSPCFEKFSSAGPDRV